MGPKGRAEDAISDVLTFIPFRELPWWFKLQLGRSRVTRFVYRLWSPIADAGEGVTRVVKRVFHRPHDRDSG
jgi:hypothetical protein